MKVRIGSTKYELKKTTDDLFLDEDAQVLGTIDSANCEIELDVKFSIEKRKQVFWHEVVHGMMWELGQEDLGHDEGFVDSLSRQLYAFHNDNKLDKIYENLA